MSSITIDQLLTTLSDDDIFARLLATATALEFPVTDWEEGGVARTFMRVFSNDLAKFSQAIPQLAAMGNLDTAQGDWLTLLAQSRFGNQRNPAINTIGKMLFTTAATTSVTIYPGSHVVQYGGIKFETRDSVTLSGGSATSVTMAAQLAGSSGNIANNVAVTLVTQTSGLVVTNPIYAGSSWITTPGQDQESDATLRDRCKAKFGSLSAGGPALAYKYWALTADPSVRRVQIGALTAPFTFPVYIAGSTSTALSGTVVTAVQNYINLYKPQAAVPQVSAASTQSVAITATVTTSTSDPITSADIQAGITAWINALPIGGETIGGLNKLYNYRLVEAIRALSPYIKHVVATPADTSITAGNIVTTSSITITLNKE